MQPTNLTFSGLARQFFRSTQQELEVDVTREEAQERLGALVAKVTWSGPDFSKPLFGSVNAKGFSLKILRQGSQGVETAARGRWVEDGKGLRVTVTYGVPPLNRAFLLVWLSFAALMTALSVPDALLGRIPAGRNVFPAFIPLLLFLGGLGMGFAGLRTGREDEAVLRDAIEAALRGQAVKVQAP